MAHEELFAVLVDCAVNGKRCPVREALPGGSNAIGALAREGKIRIEVYRLNYRVVTIMVGEHAGKRTLDAPDRHPRDKPYMVVDANSRPLHNTKIEKARFRAPWKPGDPKP